MARRNRLKEMEEKFGKPLDDLIIPLVNNGGQKRAAEVLDVSQAAISFWLNRNNYTQKITYVKQGALKQ